VDSVKIWGVDGACEIGPIVQVLCGSARVDGRRERKEIPTRQITLTNLTTLTKLKRMGCMKEEIRNCVYTIIAMLAKRDPSIQRQPGPDPGRVLNENVAALLKEVDETEDEFASGVLMSLRAARGLDPKITDELKKRFGEVDKPKTAFKETTDPGKSKR
jgi:hypothetical protein